MRFDILSDEATLVALSAWRLMTGARRSACPGRRALTEIQHDVKEAREAIEEVVDSDQALTALCLRDDEAPEPDQAPRHHRRWHHPQQASSQLSAIWWVLTPFSRVLRWLKGSGCAVGG